MDSMGETVPPPAPALHRPLQDESIAAQEHMYNSAFVARDLTGPRTVPVSAPWICPYG